MKSQILLFFVVLFFVSSISAQPGLYGGFNPDNLCNFKEGKTIFVGRVISTEKVSDNSLPEILKDPSKHTLKHSVSVEKVFNGKLKLQEVREVFGKTGYKNPQIKVNDQRIFVVDEISQNESIFLRMVDSSIPLIIYNAEEKAVRFSRIEARLNRYPKSPLLSGIVLQTDAAPKNLPLELSIKFGIYDDDVEKFKHVAGISVKAKSKKNGQVFRTETNENGVFTFDNLDDGEYIVSIVVPNGFEQVFLYEQHKDHENIVTLKKNSCGPPSIYKIRKTKRL